MEFENLIKLINTVSASDLTGFQYEENDVKIKMSKKGNKDTAVVAHAAVPAGAVNMAAAAGTQTADITAAAKELPAGNIVESPLVGTFYAAPAEDAAPFVSVGDTVKKGQTLAIVEAMKLMNEIESEFDGVVTEVLVENGQPVEYGQPLFVIG